MMNRGNGPLTRRDVCGMAVAATFGFVTPAYANTAAEDYVSGIADQVMRLANNGRKGPALKSQFAALLNRYINLKGIADYALGPYAKQLPPGRRGEFYDLVDTSILKRFRNAKPRSADGASRVYDASGRTIQLTTAEVDGRAVVLYVDVPTGAPTDVLDLRRVTLGK